MEFNIFFFFLSINFNHGYFDTIYIIKHSFSLLISHEILTKQFLFHFTFSKASWSSRALTTVSLKPQSKVPQLCTVYTTCLEEGWLRTDQTWAAWASLAAAWNVAPVAAGAPWRQAIILLLKYKLSSCSDQRCNFKLVHKHKCHEYN